MNGVRHDYILNGSTILAELWTENGISYGMYFTYDEKGMPFTMEYRVGGHAGIGFNFSQFSREMQEVIGIWQEE